MYKKFFIYNFVDAKEKVIFLQMGEKVIFQKEEKVIFSKGKILEISFEMKAM